MKHDDEGGLPPILLPGYAERQNARAIIVLSALFVACQWLLIIAAPGSMGPEPPWAGAWVLVAVAMQTTGLAWMARIYWAATHVEPDHGSWRYRD